MIFSMFIFFLSFSFALFILAELGKRELLGVLASVIVLLVGAMTVNEGVLIGFSKDSSQSATHSIVGDRVRETFTTATGSYFQENDTTTNTISGFESSSTSYYDWDQLNVDLGNDGFLSIQNSFGTILILLGLWGIYTYGIKMADIRELWTRFK